MGLASWTTNPCGYNFPGVYTKINPYAEWIDSFIKPDIATTTEQPSTPFDSTTTVTTLDPVSTSSVPETTTAEPDTTTVEETSTITATATTTIEPNSTTVEQTSTITATATTAIESDTTTE